LLEGWPWVADGLEEFDCPCEPGRPAVVDCPWDGLDCPGVVELGLCAQPVPANGISAATAALISDLEFMMCSFA
jgi:hypothetical protein